MGKEFTYIFTHVYEDKHRRKAKKPKRKQKTVHNGVNFATPATNDWLSQIEYHILCGTINRSVTHTAMAANATSVMNDKRAWQRFKP